MDIPDVIGFILDDAVQILKNNGFNQYVITETEAPKSIRNQTQIVRVLKTEILETGDVSILVCRTDFMPLI